MTSTVVEYENLMRSSFTDANKSARSGGMARWERKQLQQRLGKRSVLSDSSNVGKQESDRFIPKRGSMDIELSAYTVKSISEKGGGSEDGSDESEFNTSVKPAEGEENIMYKSVLSSAMLGVKDPATSHRILSFQDKAPAPKGDTLNNLKVLYSQSKASASNPKLVSRSIPSAPIRVLDAPDLMDDYYLNLLSWSDQNVMAVALGQTVYLWDAATGNIQELCTLSETSEGEESYVSSLSWVQKGGMHLAIGTSSGKTQLWDAGAQKLLRTMDGHSDRVGSMSWNNHILSTGGRDSVVVNHDVRIAKHQLSTMCSHTQEVCGLSWSPDGTTLASGGNDNTLCLWDVHTSGSTHSPRFSLTDHQAAVKALAWSPHERNLLATGGGTADRSIKFWNSQTGALLNSIDTGSQVCSLLWNPHEKEILSSHGFAKNQLCLWKYPTMAKVKELNGHTARVLHLAQSPDGSTVVSAAADETLRFWNIFEPSKASKTSTSDPLRANSKKLSKSMHMR